MNYFCIELELRTNFYWVTACHCKALGAQKIVKTYDVFI
jgi:hypothetical protein